MQLGDGFWKKAALLVGGAILFAWILRDFSGVASLLSFIWGLLFPFILGYIFAFLLNLAMSPIERLIFRGKGGKAARPLSFVISLVVVLGIITAVFVIVIPQLVSTIGVLVANMPGYIKDLEKTVQPIAEYIPQIEKWVQNLNFDWGNLISQAGTILQNGAVGFFTSAVGVATNIIGGMVSFFIAIIFATYLLLDKEHLTAQLKGLLQAYLPQKRYRSIVKLGQLLHLNYSSFVSSQILEALILAVIYTIVLSIGGFQYALLISVFVGFTSLIPMIGGWIGGALGVFLLLVSMGFGRALAFVIILIVVQQIEANLIYPHIVGRGMGLPAIWILVAVMVGGGLAGIFGMMIFIPLFSVLYTLLHAAATKKLKAKGIPSPVSEIAIKGKHRKRTKNKEEAAPTTPSKPFEYYDDDMHYDSKG